jgi:hypothetical protein
VRRPAVAPPAKTKAVFEHLKKCADQMRTVTYGELAKECGLAPSGIGYQLGYVRDEICRKRGLPWLSAIAVNTDTRRPGGSFLPEGVTLGDDGDRLWRGMVLHVFAFDWSSVSFEQP